LDNFKTVYDYQISWKTPLKLIDNVISGFKIFISNLKDKKFSLFVQETDSIQALK
jgi:hypothetical protein